MCAWKILKSWPKKITTSSEESEKPSKSLNTLEILIGMEVWRSMKIGFH
jgi:hypothetical protein